MTNSDRKEKLPGYFDSAWPVECGGNRRQKAATGKLLSKNSKTENNKNENARSSISQSN